MTRAIWVNGRLCRDEEAVISLFDRGARDGEGLFETLRIESGRPLDWDAHLERLVLSAAELGFPVPPGPAEIRAGLERVLEASRLEDAVARVTVTRGIPGGRPVRTGFWIEAEPLAGRLWRGTRLGVARAVISRVAFEPGPLGRHKTTSRLAYRLALEEARVARADETLLHAADGELLEGAVSNLFLVIAGEVVTPPLSRGILPGTVRAAVLKSCARLGIPAREARLSPSDLARADEAFLTNAVQQVVPLERAGEKRLPDRAIATRIAAAYQESAIAGIAAPPRAHSPSRGR